MWDRPAALNRIADSLMALTVLLAVYAALHYVLHLPLFALREVRIVGSVTHLQREEIEGVLWRELKGNFFTLDLPSLRRAFERLPWVRTATLRRRWPDRLDVTLEEHVPLARWGAGELVDRHGDIFPATYEGRLPEFTGPRDSAKEIAIEYEAFRRSLAAIGKTLDAVRLTPRGAWALRLEDGLTLELGREQIEERLARFVAVYGRTLEPLERPIDYVDLRYANGFAVRIPELGLEKTAPKGRRGRG